MGVWREVWRWAPLGVLVLLMVAAAAWVKSSGQTIEFAVGPISFKLAAPEPTAAKNCREMRIASETTKQGINEQINQAQRDIVELQKSVDANMVKRLEAMEADETAARRNSSAAQTRRPFYLALTERGRENVFNEEIERIQAMQRDKQKLVDDARRHHAAVDDGVSATCKNLTGS